MKVLFETTPSDASYLIGMAVDKNGFNPIPRLAGASGVVSFAPLVNSSVSVCRKATMSSISFSVRAGPALAGRSNGERSFTIFGR